MTIYNLSTSSALQSGSKSASSGALSQLADDQDSFLQLLTAQIKYQDPLQPMDGTEFMAQLAQLAQTEQAIKTNQNIESLHAALAMSSSLNQASLIGKEVTAYSETFVLGSDGGKFSYSMESDVTAVSAIITDASGKVVHKIDGLPVEGGVVTDVSWDGLDAEGNPIAAGEYTVTLATTGGSGSYNTYATAKVVAIEFDTGTPVLRFEDGRTAEVGSLIRAG